MAEKTEAPTPRKLADAREQGQVARSHEINAAVVLLVAAFILQTLGKNMVRTISNLLVDTIQNLSTVEFSAAWFRDYSAKSLLALLPSLGIIMAVVLVVGVAVTLAQTRFLFSTKKLAPDFSRINPIKGLKRIFSKTTLFELAKTIVKLLVIGWTLYSYLKTNYMQIVSLAGMDLNASISQLAKFFFALMTRVAIIYFVIAAADYAYQLWSFNHNLRMTKQEVKEDMRRSEGDPLIKSRIRAMQRRNSRRRMMAAVPKATVIVTNPTHLAIAIQYSKDMRAPKILAKGMNKIAENIVKIAKGNNIPIVQNIPLAWAIYKTIDIDQEISPDLYKAVAEVLAYVLKTKSGGVHSAVKMTPQNSTGN
jgi:flagellar biosynthetic protein FlhB